MNRRLPGINAASGWGAIAGIALAMVVALVTALLVLLALVVPAPAVALARDASLAILWAVVLVTMALLTALFYTEYLLLREAMGR